MVEIVVFSDVVWPLVDGHCAPPLRPSEGPRRTGQRHRPPAPRHHALQPRNPHGVDWRQVPARHPGALQTEPAIYDEIIAEASSEPSLCDV